MVAQILGGLTVLSAGINVWQWIVAGNFPLHRRNPSRDFAPPLTLFKPLKGADDYTQNCLESWLAQDYRGATQILFGVADAHDPACQIVRDLLKLYPTHDAELVVCQPLLGANAKVSTLAHLQKKAKHDHWIVSDADVFAPEDLLSEIALKFRDDNTALVNCFYKLGSPESFGMLWEAVAMNADFWSQVCQNNSLQPMNFALGAVMAVRRGAVAKIGGFQSLVNQLADDYQLGRRIADTGGKIELATIVVECRENAKTFWETWKHQLRWARTIRVCQPEPYFMSILSNTTIFALADWAAGGDATLARAGLALRVLTAMHNQFRLTQQPSRLVEAIFTPIKDLLHFAVWLGSFAGSKVRWRGEEFRVKRGGELVRV